MGEINHFSHEQHSLKLIENWETIVDVHGEKKGEVHCEGCRDPISTVGGSAYGCISCRYFLHKKCAELPPTTINHHFHPLHRPLTLIVRRSINWYCDVCGTRNLRKGFSYYCSECDFDACVKCGADEKHSLKLIENWETIVNDLDEKKGVVPCEVCRDPISTVGGSAYGCISCRYFLHNKCAELPPTINHYFHPLHPLTLIVRRVKWRCSVCRMQHLAKGFSYYCSECEFDACIKCGAIVVSEEASKKLEDEKVELRSQIDNLTEKINNMKVELESVSTQKQESDNQVEKLSLQISDYLVKIETLTEEVANKNQDQERLLEEHKSRESKIKELESKLKETLESKDQIVDQQEETIKDLRSDLEIKGDELNTLTEMIRNLEVKIQLATQKLRLTEQTLNGTINENAKKEEKLRQENKSLMEKNTTLSQTIATIKREVQENVNEILSGTDSLIVKFEEDYGHVTIRVYEMTNEVQAARVQIKKMKEDMMQKVEEMAMKLQVSEGENETLMKSLEDMKAGIVNKDEKIKELESIIRLKDERILDLSEDKREAIKQLCIWADYQRDRHDQLQEILLKRTTGARRQTVS